MGVLEREERADVGAPERGAAARGTSGEARAERFELPSRIIVGRTEHCDLRLEDVRVSGEHASIYFEDDKWMIRDLSSRNGTTVNGTALKPRDRRALSEGSRICFGSSDQCWLLVNVEPPSGEGIEMTVQSTLELANVTFRFRVTPEEENVFVTLSHAGGSIEVPTRAYLYLLLVLARARRADRESDVPESEQGWLHTEDLVPRLYPDLETLNVNVFRARKLFSQLGLRDAEHLVERRGGSGQLRLGASRLVFERVTGDMTPS